MRVFLALCVLAATAAATPAFLSNSHYGYELDLNPNTFQTVLKSMGFHLLGEESFPEARRVLLQAALKFGEDFLTHPDNTVGVAHALRKHFPTGTPSAAAVADKVRTLLHADSADIITAADGLPTLGDDQYPYFGFIPPLMDSVVPDADAVSFSTACWGSVTASGVTNSNGSVTISVTVDDQKEAFCSDHFMFGTVETVRLGVKLGDKGTHTFLWKASSSRTTAEAWDLAHKGVRMYRFNDGIIETVIQIVDTALLFVPELINPVGSAATKRNLYFMKEYAGVDMKPRKTQVVNLDESKIQSGDFFGIIRLDGLDPMLAWAMGSTTGHTTVALRDPDSGELYITESTVKDDYWPTNGIQRTPYKQWVQQAINASFQVVHAPLTADAAAKFNVTKAWQWFNKTEGLDYGYHNMLWGWVDTVKDNYPCLPPDFSSTCLEWSHVEVLFSVINKLVPSIGELLFMQAWNLRLGTVGLPPADLYQLAAEKGMDSDVIPTIVEEDNWMYNTTRYGKPTKGPSSVCCVHVCRTWKAAGLFDDFNSEINCAELTNSDDYQMTIMNGSPDRPAACVEADPDNKLCQIVGAYTLNLNGLSTIKPYAHMDEKCPSLAPNYTRPAGC